MGTPHYDKDVSTLTEFAPPQQDKGILKRWLNWGGINRDYSQENIVGPAELRSEKIASGTSPPNSIITKLKSSLATRKETADTKKYWMPDDASDVCYDCQQPFTVFTRRHHCRICGQIFCYKCSDNSIEDYQGYDGPIRVCNYCYKLLHTPQDMDGSEGARRDSTGAFEDNNESLDRDKEKDPAAHSDFMHKLIHSSSYLLHSPFLNRKEQLVGASSSEKLDELADNVDPPIFMEEDEEYESEEEDEEFGESGKSGRSDIDELSENKGSATVGIKEAIITDAHQPPPSPHEQSLPHNPLDDDSIGRRSASPILTQSGGSSNPSNVPVHLSEPSLRPLRQHPRVTNRAKAWEQFPLRENNDVHLDTTGTSHDMDADAQLHRGQLSKASDDHLLAIVTELLNYEGLNGKWTSVIIRFAQSVCQNIQLNVKSGDRMNVLNYVKVKKIPGGTVQECTYIDGVIISKNVTHKKMAPIFTSPKILLLSCSLEYQRVENRLLFFDYLISQERPYLKILVSKIAALQPDLVVVEKTVSRHAQDFLLGENVTLVANIVKPHVMERLGRLLRGDVLPTLDILLPVGPSTIIAPGSAGMISPGISGNLTSIPPLPISPPPSPLIPPKMLKAGDAATCLGSCGQFRVETFTGDWGRKTLMFFEGCPKELGCTLAVRGDALEVLDKVKKVLLFSIYVAYNLHLETSLLFEENCTLNKSSMTESREGNQKEHILSCSPNVRFPSALRDFSRTQLQNQIPHIRYISLHNETKAGLIASFHAPHTHLEASDRASLLQSINTEEDNSVGMGVGVSGGCTCNHPHIISDAEILGLSSDEKTHDYYSQQSIVYVHSLLCSSTSTQCIPHELHSIDYYSDNDLTIGEFLEQMCFDADLICQVKDCNKSVVQHERAFIHGTSGRLNVSVEKVAYELPTKVENSNETGIYVWSLCRICRSVTPLTPMSRDTWTYSFGKFLELSFYSFEAVSRTVACHHSVHRDHIRYFSRGSLVAQIAYEPIDLLVVTVPPLRLRHDPNMKVVLRLKELELLSQCAEQVYEAILAKLRQLETDTSRSSSLHTDLSQVHTFTQSLSNEKAVFMSKLASVQTQVVDDSTDPLKDLTRTLYASFITWNSTLNELVNNVSTNEYKPKYQSKRIVSISTPNVLESSPKPTQTLLENTNNSTDSNTAVTGTTGTENSSAVANSAVPKSTENIDVNKEPVGMTGINPPSYVMNSSNSSPSTNADNHAVKSEEEDAKKGVEEWVNGGVNCVAAGADNEVAVFQQPTQLSNIPSGSIVFGNNIIDSITGPSNSPKVTTTVPLQPVSSSMKPSKIINTITNLVSAISSSRILDPTIPYLFLPQGANDIIVAIYENEPSTIIAYTLSSNEFKEKFDALTGISMPVQSRSRSSSISSPPSLVTTEEGSGSFGGGAKNASGTFTEGRKRSNSTVASPEDIKFNTIMMGNSEPDAVTGLFTDRNVTLAKYLLSGERREIRNKYQYEKHNYSVIIHCTTYYPLQFNALRELVAGPNGDERFIESLSRCKNWNAKGGKSGSTWAKTLDDRFVLKQISRIELESFLDFAPSYFEYICKSFFHKVPTALAKIFGIFSVRWKNSSGKSLKKDLIVMENLFYNKKISQIYDLKGSLRGRFVQNPIQAEVLLDENLLQTTYTSPICIPEHSKTLLGQAVWNDTAFLSSLNVMDYSLLAGIDSEKNELVVGIIDYMRRFTWDKQLEAWVKSSGLMGGRGKVPTVISPKQYKVRFRDAMWMYFVMVPNKFTKVLNPPACEKKKDQSKDQT